MFKKTKGLFKRCFSANKRFELLNDVFTVQCPFDEINGIEVIKLQTAISNDC